MPVASKLYCFLDESGQTTLDPLHVVGPILLLGDDGASLRLRLRAIEQVANPRRRKWQRASHRYRADYLRRVLGGAGATASLYWAAFWDRSDFFEMAADAVAAAVRHAGAAEAQIRLDYDGLPRKKRRFVTARLRAHQLKVRNKHVRSADDAKCEIIRLSDMLCGFLRDYEEGQGWARRFFAQHANGKLIRLTDVSGPPS